MMAVEVLLFVAVVGVVAALGIRIGMLVAPRLERLADDADEEASGDT
jgi:hypothetical protein